MFGKTTDPVLTDLAKRITDLTKEIACLRGKRDQLHEEFTLSDQVVTLRKELETLKLEKDRKEEKHAREKRETEHLVGLQKKRADQERELAVKEAKLEVREGNLTAKEDMFEERLDAITTQLKEQVDYLRTDIVKSLMERLPIFNVESVLNPQTGNGRGRALKVGKDD